MSNQRPGKVIRAADPTMKDMTTLKFLSKKLNQTIKS